MDMKEFEIREYPEDEYKADMLELLAAKGLKQAVKKYLDMIVEETSGLPYIPNMSIKEWACDILTVCELEEERTTRDDPDTNVGNIDCISREDAIRIASGECHFSNIPEELKKLPPVNPQLKTGHCKDCKYFEYDSVAKVNGIPLIVAHEICSRWGDGCKTSEYGYCFLFEPKAESENKAK